MACHLAENDRACYESFSYSFSLDFLGSIVVSYFKFIESNYCSTLLDKFPISLLKGTLLFLVLIFYSVVLSWTLKS